MRILESERILIKPVEEADLDYLLNLRWEASVMNYLIHEPLSIKDQNDWLSNISKKDIPLCIFIKGNKNEKERAGTIGLYNINMRHQRATWRLRIDPAQQGKGIAYESAKMLFNYGFNTLNINKIISDSFVDNEPIINLYIKLGMKKEATLKKHYFHQGKFRDGFQFRILREEFNKNGIKSFQYRPK